MDTSIPKVIHYCWFGNNELSALAVTCIESWKKYFPNYKIIEWNEENFDINMHPFVKQAYEAGNYAFVSDFARLWILYNNGGVYFDVDVEVIKPFDKILENGAFLGCESLSKNRITINPGLGFACEKNNFIIGQILNNYKRLNYIDKETADRAKTIVEYSTEVILRFGLRPVNEVQKIEDIYVYPKDYFCPLDYFSNKLEITDNTLSIHHFNASWIGKKQKLFLFVARTFGLKFAEFCSKLYKKRI